MTALRDPCAVAVVFAVPIEADAFERLATARVETRAAGLVIHEGTVGGARVAWCVGGVGTEAAARATRLLIAGHRPRLLVSAGFAGGLDSTLRRGAVVRPTMSIIDADPHPLPLASPRATATSTEPATGPTIVTVADIVATPAAKRLLAARTGAHLVDMETHAVVQIASKAGIPCASIRVISDTVSDELPREVAALAHPQSTMRRLGTALGAIGRRPKAALDLWRLYEHAVVDARALAHAIASLCSIPGS